MSARVADSGYGPSPTDTIVQSIRLQTSRVMLAERELPEGDHDPIRANGVHRRNLPRPNGRKMAGKLGARAHSGTHTAASMLRSVWCKPDWFSVWPATISLALGAAAIWQLAARAAGRVL